MLFLLKPGTSQEYLNNLIQSGYFDCNSIGNARGTFCIVHPEILHNDLEHLGREIIRGRDKNELNAEGVRTINTLKATMNQIAGVEKK